MANTAVRKTKDFTPGNCPVVYCMIIERIIYAEIPPRVEYKITPYGNTLLPIIDSMSKWGKQNMSRDKKSYCDVK